MNDNGLQIGEGVIIENELDRYGAYASVTRGVSMRPLFKTHRDVVVVKKCDGELRKYDVALYRSPTGSYVLHRVIKVLPDTYLIRGDNTFVIEKVPKNRIIGILSEFNRKGKQYTVNGTGYKIYSRLWNFLYPLRKLLFILKRFLHRLYRVIFKKKEKSNK